VFVIVELLYGIWGRRERKRKCMRRSTILNYVASVQVDDIMICAESSRIVSSGRKGDK
jgi:hypothetical protein